MATRHQSVSHITVHRYLHCRSCQRYEFTYKYSSKNSSSWSRIMTIIIVDASTKCLSTGSSSPGLGRQAGNLLLLLMVVDSMFQSSSTREVSADITNWTLCGRRTTYCGQARECFCALYHDRHPMQCLLCVANLFDIVSKCETEWEIVESHEGGTISWPVVGLRSTTLINTVHNIILLFLLFILAGVITKGTTLCSTARWTW